MLNELKQTCSIEDLQVLAALWGVSLCRAEIQAAARWLRQGYEVAFIYAQTELDRLIAAPFGGPEGRGDDTFCRPPIKPPRAGDRHSWRHATDRKGKEFDAWFTLASAGKAETPAKIYFRLANSLRWQHATNWTLDQAKGLPTWQVPYISAAGKKISPEEKLGFEARRAWIARSIASNLARKKEVDAARKARMPEWKKQAAENARQKVVADKAAKRLRADELSAAKAMRKQAARWKKEVATIEKRLAAKKGKWTTSASRTDLLAQRNRLVDLVAQMGTKAAKLDGSASKAESAKWSEDQKKLESVRDVERAKGHAIGVLLEKEASAKNSDTVRWRISGSINGVGFRGHTHQFKVGIDRPLHPSEYVKTLNRTDGTGRPLPHSVTSAVYSALARELAKVGKQAT